LWRLRLETSSQGIDRAGRKSLTREEYVLEQCGTHTRRGDENRRIAAENTLREERRRLARTESGGGGLRAWFESFSYQFSGSMDAARDAVHRFRARDAEKEGATVSDDRFDLSVTIIRGRSPSGKVCHRVHTVCRQPSRKVPTRFGHTHLILTMRARQHGCRTP